MKTVCAKLLSAALVLLSTVSVFAGAKGRANAVVIPRLIVTESKVTSGEVKAGDDFEMVIHMKNESKNKLTNVKLELSSEGNEVVPKSGTNSLYITEIDKEAEIDVSVDMTTRSDLVPGTYSVSLHYIYEDNDWRTFEDNAVLSVPVVQIPKLSLTEMKLTRDTIFLDGKTSCSLKINNTGKSDISNVSVVIDGNNIKSVERFIGKLPVDMSQDIDLSLLATELGTGDIKATVTYEDSEGNIYTEEDSLQLEVMEPVIEEVVVETPIYQQPIAWIIAGAVLFVVIIVNVIRKKREKKYA